MTSYYYLCPSRTVKVFNGQAIRTVKTHISCRAFHMMSTRTPDPWCVEDPWSKAASARFAHTKLTKSKQSDEALLAHAMMKGLAEGGASRQVVVAAASAIIRTHHYAELEIDTGDQKQLVMTEKIKAVVEAAYGRPVGISQVCKDLKANGRIELAQAVASQNRCRNLAAHPPRDLDQKL